MSFKINKNGYWETSDASGHCYDTALCEVIKTIVKGKSLLDLGCGTGAYTRELSLVCTSAKGYDGNPNTKQISNGLCDVADLTQHNTFDKVNWVLSLEVGEHIPKQFEDVLFENICNHAIDGVILSWAVPGQPGDGHVNCQSNEYVLLQMLARGFKFDRESSEKLRSSAELWWFKNTIMCFKRVVMPQITFCIPSKNNLRYLKACIPSIRKNSVRVDHDIIVFVDKDTDGTLDWLRSECNTDAHLKFIANPDLNNSLYGIGRAYDECIKASNTEVVMVFHADMMLGKNADLELYTRLDPKTCCCSLRCEPPLHPSGNEKVIQNFGLWPEQDIADGFKESEFDSFVKSCKSEYATKITNGCFAPWMVYKKEFIDMGMHDYVFKSAREDSDVFNRMKLNGFEFLQVWTSVVYHLTCRGGQFEHGILTTDPAKKSKDWQLLMHNSTMDFIRKWNSSVLTDDLLRPIVKTRYNKKFIVHNCNEFVLAGLEPWADVICVDCDYTGYIKYTQPSTAFDLRSRIFGIDSSVDADITVEFDATRLNNDNIQIITSLFSDIIDTTEGAGVFEYDAFRFYIKTKTNITYKLASSNKNYAKLINV